MNNINGITNQAYLDKFEGTLKASLHTYLKANKEVDSVLPDSPDITNLWNKIATAYLEDGVREFAGYPTVSLGWMMYVGMAVAKFWDEDWEKYSKEENLYHVIRDPRGFDCMDEYIREDVLGLTGIAFKSTEKLVGDMATITLRAIQHENFEPGSPLAFHAYVRSLHQLYIMGAAVQLNRMNYHMEKLDA